MKIFSLAAIGLLAALAAAADVTVDAVVPADLTVTQRAAAAKKTVRTNALCSPSRLKAYYWEIGDKRGPLVSGSMGTKTGTQPVTANTPMKIASASKWLFSSYVVEKHGLDAINLPYLTLTSGYSNFRSTLCVPEGTVAGCGPGALNRTESMDKVFHYDGGHMQWDAIYLGLGPLQNAGLAAEIQSVVGADVALAYVQPVLGGGATASPRSYANFMRKLLVGTAEPLQIGPLLGTQAVCTYPSLSCNASALVAIPEPWHYSLGHWVEDDPATVASGNVAYSSAGSFGFYPWVDAGRTYYGVLAREVQSYTAGDEAFASIQCGRLVRLAWKTGVVQ